MRCSTLTRDLDSQALYRRMVRRYEGGFHHFVRDSGQRLVMT